MSFRTDPFPDARSEATDRYALVGAFIIGIAGNVALKLYDVAPLPAALWSAGTIIGYAVVTWKVGLLRIEPETTGDNCYYLGFLFTLTSLAVTLYQMASDAAGEAALRNVISGFGIALSSTIVGIALRVLLLRLRPDIVAKDRQARQDLHSGIRDYRDALSVSAASLKEFATESQQLLAEERSRMLAMTEHVLQLHLKTVEEGSQARMESLEETLEQSARRTAELVAAAVDKAVKPLAETVTPAMLKVAERVAEEIGRIQEIREQSLEIADVSQDVHCRLGDIAKRLGNIAKRLDTSSNRVVEKLALASDRIEEASADAAGELEKAFRRMAEAASRFDGSEQFKKTLQIVQPPLDALQGAAERLAKVTADLEGSIAQNQVLARKTETLLEERSARAGPLCDVEELLASLSPVMEALKTASERLADSVEERSASDEEGPDPMITATDAGQIESRLRSRVDTAFPAQSGSPTSEKRAEAENAAPPDNNMATLTADDRETATEPGDEDASGTEEETADVSDTHAEVIPEPAATDGDGEERRARRAFGLFWGQRTS